MNTIRQLTDEEKASLLYFHREYGDVRRCGLLDRSETRAVLAAHHPELLDAIERVTIAERTLAALVRDL